MKKSVFSIIVFFTIFISAHAQEFENETELNPTNYQSSHPTEAELFIKLCDYANKPLMYYDVWLIEKTTKKKIEGTTDIKGTITLVLTKGSLYSVCLQDTNNYMTVEIPKGYKSTFTKKIVFDAPASYYETVAKTDTIKFNVSTKSDITDNEVSVKIKIENDKKHTISDVTVKMYSKKINKLFMATSNKTGDITMKIPADNNYIIAVGEVENYHQLSTMKRGGSVYQTSFLYIPTNFPEKNSHDTISQQLPAKPEPTSSRIMVSIKVTNPSKEILNDEPVFMAAKNSKKVYRAMTNKDGIAIFLLPKGEIYYMNFLYESNFDVLEYPYSNGLRRTKIECTYIGSKAVQEFYASIPKKQGFITEFMTKEIQKIPKFLSSVIEKTAYGYNLNFNNTNETSPPAIFKNNMLLSAGYYNPEYYCVDNKTGESKWGIKLAENGPSPAVCEDSVLLINTQSCTLYAIDLVAGNLLWSKWLGPNLYSTPTVSKGVVYACYPRNVSYDYKNRDSAYVLVAFALKTGKIIWQNWIDGEAVGAPVVADNSIFVTTDIESLYKFDLKNGKKIAVKKGGYISAPTIVNDQLYVFKQSGKEKSNLLILSATDLKQVHSVEKISSSGTKSISGVSAFTRMCFNKNRVMHYKGKNYCVVSGSLLCFDNLLGNILWKKDIYDSAKIDPLHESVMPLAVAGELIITTPLGKLLFLDANTGVVKNQYSFAGEQLTDAIAHDGWVYSGTKQGKIISFNTKNKNITGWNTWSGNNRHNPVVL